MDDPAQVVSWFEYPGETFSRYYFINTDWTRADRHADCTVTLGNAIIPLCLAPVRPVHLASDGRTHLVLDDPALQVAAWTRDGDACDVAIIGGDPSAVRVYGAGTVRLHAREREIVR